MCWLCCAVCRALTEILNVPSRPPPTHTRKHTQLHNYSTFCLQCTDVHIRLRLDTGMEKECEEQTVANCCASMCLICIRSVLMRSSNQWRTIVQWPETWGWSSSTGWLTTLMFPSSPYVQSLLSHPVSLSSPQERSCRDRGHQPVASPDTTCTAPGRLSGPKLFFSMTQWSVRTVTVASSRMSRQDQSAGDATEHKHSGMDLEM